jgi:hypothetical protein
MPQLSIVHYDTNDPPDVKETALLMGLETILYELLEGGWPADDLLSRCDDVIADAAEEIAAGDEEAEDA